MTPCPNISLHLPLLALYASSCEVLLEVGAGVGDGSMFAFNTGMMWNTHAKKYITVDIVDKIPSERKPKLDFWKFIIGDSRSPETLDKIRKELGNMKADLIFIDTDHKYEILKEELKNLHEISSCRCTWLFHDTYMEGKYNKMTDAIKEFAVEKGFTYKDLSTDCHGLGAILPWKREEWEGGIR